MNKYPDIVYNNLYIVFKRKPSRCPQRDRIKFSTFYRFKQKMLFMNFTNGSQQDKYSYDFSFSLPLSLSM